MHFNYTPCKPQSCQTDCGKQKGHAAILILVGILILVAVAGGAYYYGKPQTPQITPVPSSTPDASRESNDSAETANWKTYTNNTYGFEVSYPGKWFYKEFSFIDPILDVGFKSVPPTSVDTNPISIYISKKTYAEQSKIDSSNKQIVKIGNVEGIKRTADSPEGYASIFVAFPLKEGSIVLTSNKEEEQIFDQILSTFKFIQ